ncbi:MAG: hypothetical protein JSW35_09355 [Deltaproteobacteria bacterium]|nr:MAG: hypothetical protein JSW35_09355 [Deltaproteobacteria bacterium]
MESKTLLQTVVDGISEPLIMLDQSSSIKMLNRAAKDYYQVKTQDTIIDKPCHQAFKGRPDPCKGCTIPSAILDSKAVTFERKGFFDSARIERVVIYPLKEKHNGLEGAIVRIGDVTDARFMERQLLQNEKLASLGLLVSGIAHEINNPNNLISFNIPILRDYLKKLIPFVEDYVKYHRGFELFGMSYPELREDIFKLLDNVEHGSSRINFIVSDLREFSRKKDKREHVWLDIRQGIQKVVGICRGKIEKMVKSFELHIPESLPPILADLESLEQILVNVLINAAQAADKEDSWVRLSAKLGNTWRDHLIIEVSDNGCGMDEETRGKIFDPFFTTKGPEDGTGLGLYVCHNLIEELGGRIEVESEPRQGSSFRIILPHKGHDRA